MCFIFTPYLLCLYPKIYHIQKKLVLFSFAQKDTKVRSLLFAQEDKIEFLFLI